MLLHSPPDATLSAAMNSFKPDDRIIFIIEDDPGYLSYRSVVVVVGDLAKCLPQTRGRAFGIAKKLDGAKPSIALSHRVAGNPAALRFDRDERQPLQRIQAVPRDIACKRIDLLALAKVLNDLLLGFERFVTWVLQIKKDASYIDIVNILGRGRHGSPLSLHTRCW